MAKSKSYRETGGNGFLAGSKTHQEKQATKREDSFNGARRYRVDKDPIGSDGEGVFRRKKYINDGKTSTSIKNKAIDIENNVKDQLNDSNKQFWGEGKYSTNGKFSKTAKNMMASAFKTYGARAKKGASKVLDTVGKGVEAVEKTTSNTKYNNAYKKAMSSHTKKKASGTSTMRMARAKIESIDDEGTPL